MKFTRSTKCSVKFTTKAKKESLNKLMHEYSRVVNFFIKCFWLNVPLKKDLLKPVVDRPLEELPGGTWLSFRMRKVAAREAIDLCLAVERRRKDQPKKMKSPKHSGRSMSISDKAVTLQPPKAASEFDAWIHMSSLGEKLIFDIPIRFHKHYNELARQGKRLNHCVLKRDSVQFSIWNRYWDQSLIFPLKRLTVRSWNH